MPTTLDPTTATAVAPREIDLRFAGGMPGLEQYTRYTLVGVDDAPVYWLHCDEEPAIALPVADAFAVAPDYSLSLPEADARALDLRDTADALVLVVLTVARESGTITANLLAPIVVNRSNRTARQVILDGTSYSLRHPVVAGETV